MITAFLYDADGTDSGKEWVELYNPTDIPLDLSDYSLQGGNGANPGEWWTAWQGTSGEIQPHGHLLIGGTDVVPSPDEIAALGLQNGPDAVRLLRGTDVVETIGWGDLDHPEFYDGTPFEGSEGPIRRLMVNGTYQQTRDNAQDFVADETYRPRTSDQQDLHVMFSVMERYAHLRNISLLDEDPLADGNQVVPRPGLSKDITVDVTISTGEPCDTLGVTLLHDNESRQMISQGQDNETCMFTSTVTRDYSDDPAEYPVSFEVSAEGELLNTTSTSYQYLGMAAFSIDADVLDFGDLHTGEDLSIHGDLDEATHDRPTIRNTGNVPLDIGVMGSRISSSGSSMNASVLSYHIDDGTHTYAGAFSHGLANVGMSLERRALAALSLTLAVPADAKGGDFAGDLAFLARGAE